MWKYLCKDCQAPVHVFCEKAETCFRRNNGENLTRISEFLQSMLGCLPINLLFCFSQQSFSPLSFYARKNHEAQKVKWLQYPISQTRKLWHDCLDLNLHILPGHSVHSLLAHRDPDAFIQQAFIRYIWPHHNVEDCILFITVF